jgi:hypothetical protein
MEKLERILTEYKKSDNTIGDLTKIGTQKEIEFAE